MSAENTIPSGAELVEAWHQRAEQTERIASLREQFGEFGFWTDGEYGRGGGDWVTVADLLDDLIRPAKWLHPYERSEE